MIDQRVKVFLSVLKDGRWHRKFPLEKIPLYVVEVCLDLKLVEQELTKKIQVTRNHDRYQARFRITNRGQRALEKGKAPTWEDVQLTRRVLVFKGRVFSGTAFDMARWRGLQRRLNAR